MKPSLLRRMIIAQGMVLLAVSGLLMALVFGALALSKKGIWDEGLEFRATAMTTLLQDAPDLARMRTLAKRIQMVEESIVVKGPEVKPGEYQSINQVFDAENRLLTRSEAGPRINLGRLVSGFHDLESDGIAWRVLVKVDPVSGLKVVAAQPKDLGVRIILRSLRTFPLQVLIGVVMTALFTWLVCRRAMLPLHRLAQAVEGRKPEDLTALAGHSGLAETKPLVAALNSLFQRVEALVETQRRFVADAAHELRTPLAVIGAQDLQQGIRRASQLAGQLFSVAQLDDASERIQEQPIDLAMLARERVTMLQPQAELKRHLLVYEGPGALPWTGDASILASAVDNLLINAIRYTPPGGRITLRLGAPAGSARLEVEDTGPGIPAAFREAMFERFCRLPGTEEAGSGLGLAIVRRAVELHGGTVSLADRAGGPGLRATILLPRRHS